MKLNKSAQTLLERYLLAVRRALASKDRADICKEIESYLLDNLEERHPKAQEISEAQVLGLLHELGSPAKLAAQFSPQLCLIGPRLFPGYIAVLRIVVPVVLGALALSLVIRAATGELSGGAWQALNFLGTLWNGAFMAAAYVTLVFVIIERTSADKAYKELEDFEKFDPSELPDLADEEKEPGVLGMAFEIVFGTLGLAICTYLYSSGGRLPLFVFSFSDGGLSQVRIFTDNFMPFLPFMIALYGLEISHAAALLALRRRTPLTDWWHACTQFANLVLFVLLLGAFPLVTLSPLAGQPFAADWDIARVNAALDTGLRVVLALAIFFTLIELGQLFYRHVLRPES